MEVSGLVHMLLLVNQFVEVSHSELALYSFGLQKLRCTAFYRPLAASTDSLNSSKSPHLGTSFLPDNSLPVLNQVLFVCFLVCVLDF